VRVLYAADFVIGRESLCGRFRQNRSDGRIACNSHEDTIILFVKKKSAAKMLSGKAGINKLSLGEEIYR